ncbi:MAG: methyltransferase domain-containing protein [Rhodocyclales bacterium]|nr:methyltransferase domain-containing protein [Rhodocyclales bacterium]
MTEPVDTVCACSIRKYRRHAAGYDASCGRTWSIRERTIAALELQPGQRVLDVGCGTGLSLPLLHAAVGTKGRIYGLDQSPDMLALARRRVGEQGWTNVCLLEGAAQLAALPEPVDALLFHYTHDVLRSPAALTRLLALARPRARVAVAGIKYFRGWLSPLNPWVYFKNYGYNGAPGELRCPWDRIAPLLDDWQMTPTQFGMGYIGVGRVAASRDAAGVALQPGR